MIKESMSEVGLVKSAHLFTYLSSKLRFCISLVVDSFCVHMCIELWDSSDDDLYRWWLWLVL